MKEIGSEFWIEDVSEVHHSTLGELVNFGDDQQLLFSGRTAIDFVLEDITIPIKKVYMPSYCCNSMLQPFISRNISIEFYDVISNKKSLHYLIDYEKEVDIFFAMSYFGFHQTNMDSIIEKFNRRNTVVIEDITHRLLSEQNHCKSADYTIASLRKWFPIPSGGLAVKWNGKFESHKLFPPESTLVHKKLSAMKKKSEYIKGFKKDSAYLEMLKHEFLNLFSEFNSSLSSDYKNIKIDDYSRDFLSRININYVKKKRYENSIFVYNSFNRSKLFSFLISEIHFGRDCPFFVPIMVKLNYRDRLRRHLIENKIFCPVHWPAPQDYLLNGNSANLYHEELSLVCDQRYSLTDMNRIVSVIGEFEKKYG